MPSATAASEEAQAASIVTAPPPRSKQLATRLATMLPNTPPHVSSVNSGRGRVKPSWVSAAIAAWTSAGRAWKSPADRSAAMNLPV